MNSEFTPKFRRVLVNVLSVELLAWLALAWLQGRYNYATRGLHVRG